MRRSRLLRHLRSSVFICGFPTRYGPGPSARRGSKRTPGLLPEPRATCERAASASGRVSQPRPREPPDPHWHFESSRRKLPTVSRPVNGFLGMDCAGRASPCCCSCVWVGRTVVGEPRPDRRFAHSARRGRFALPAPPTSRCTAASGSPGPGVLGSGSFGQPAQLCPGSACGAMAAPVFGRTSLTRPEWRPRARTIPSWSSGVPSSPGWLWPATHS